MATHSAQICTNFCPVPLGPNVKVLVTSHPSAFARAMLSSKSNVTSWFIYTRAAVSPPPRGHCPWPSEWTMSFHSCLCLPRSALCDSIKKSSPPHTLREREKGGGGAYVAHPTPSTSTSFDILLQKGKIGQILKAEESHNVAVPQPPHNRNWVQSHFVCGKGCWDNVHQTCIIVLDTWEALNKCYHIKKENQKPWRGGSGVKSACCSDKGPEFSFQHSRWLTVTYN